MSATGNPRNKVALKPGHSLMDWIRLGNTEDLTGTGGAILQVTKDELAKHNTEKDAWICIRGNIYNITRYLNFHPGGPEELMKGAGIDGTNLFNKIHPWVNFESILRKCLIGRLSHGVQEDVFEIPGSSKRNSKMFNNVNLLPPKIIPNDEIKLDWYQQENYVTMVIYLKEFPGKLQLSNEDMGELRISVNDQFLNWLFPQPIIWPPLLTITENKVEAKFTKEKAMAWPELPIKTRNECKPSKLYQQMVIKQIEKVNHNVYQISLSYIDRVLTYVPIGYHVPVKATINGVSVERNYTPICGLSDKLLYDINLLVKSYPDGAFSSWFTSRKVGDTVMVGSPAGTFTTSNIMKATHIVLIAAGTGLTPMIRIIDWALARRNKILGVKLIFFNKKEKDIIWKNIIEKLPLSNRSCNRWELLLPLKALEYTNSLAFTALICESPTVSETHLPPFAETREQFCHQFKAEHILSEGDPNWKDARGYVTPQLLQGYIPDFTKDDPMRYFICACGPIAFTQLADRYLQDMGYSQENFFCF